LSKAHISPRNTSNGISGETSLRPYITIPLTDPFTPEKRKYLRKSQLWSHDFTAKLFCNVEFWLERLPRLIGLCEITAAADAIVIPHSGLAPFTFMGT
jgi:hypothetical protein